MANARRTLLCAITAVALGACVTTNPSHQSLKNSVENQDRTIEALKSEVDRLHKVNSDLELEAKMLRAEVEKAKTAEAAVEEAKAEFRAHVADVLKQFRGDREVQVEPTEAGYKFVVGESVLFPSGSAELTEEGKKVLARVAASLRDGNSLVSVEGHTDNVPVAKPETLERFPRGNIELSLARALAVWEFLAKEGGIPESRLSVAGFGPHRPRAPNDSDLNRWKNRRVEILVAER